MKKRFFLMSAFLLLGVFASANAAEGPVTTGMAVVPVKGSEVFKIIYKGESTGRVKLNIYEASSRLIFSQTFSKVDGFIFPINFSGLAAGEYTIEVVDANGQKVQTVRHGDSASREITAHVNKLRDQDGKYLLSYVSSEPTDVTVRIFDGSGRLIFEETKATNGQFAKVYTLAANFGSVRFEVSDANGKVRTVRF